MQTNSYVDWMRRPLSTVVCPTPDIWPETAVAQVRHGKPRTTTRSEFVNEEKLRILKMLEDGKIDATHAVKLMEALDKTESRPSERELKKKWIHIKVQKDGRDTVNVKVPLALLKFGFKFAPHAVKHKMERAREKAERARERALRKAERAREKARRRLEQKLGPDVDIDVDEILRDVFEDAEETVENGLRGTFGHILGKDSDFDLEKILEMAQSEGFDGKLLDVYDEDEDEHVVIKLE